MSPPKVKKELQAFLEILNYLSKFSPATAEECEPLCRVTYVKNEWTWNITYQNLSDVAKALPTLTKHDETWDNAILGLTVFSSKGLSSTERKYSNIEREALGILHGHEKYHIRPQATHRDFQERCSNTITVTTVHTSKETPVQNSNTKQTQPRPLHRRVALNSELCKEQGCRNTRYETKHSSSVHYDRNPSILVHLRNKKNNTKRCASSTAERKHKWMATKQT